MSNLLNNGNSANNAQILKTDVSDILVARAQGVSRFMYDALQNGRTLPMFQPATNYKHQWMNVVTKPKFFTIASVDNGAKTITFKDNAPEVNYILSIEGETNVLVKSVNALVATVEILTEGATLENMDNAIASIVSEGTPEGRDFEDGQFQSGTPEYNYTQNFDEGYVITGSMMEMEAYANLNNIEVQQAFALDRYLKKLSNAVLRGSRYETTVNGKRVSAMGGLKSFVNVKGGNILEVTGGNPTFHDVCKVVELIASAGGDASKLRIYANLKWAPAFNAFNGNQTTTVNDANRGGIPEFILIPGAGKVEIVFDAEFMANEIYFVHKENFALIPLGSRNGYFTEIAKKSDSISSSLIAEYTLEIRNPTVDFGVIVVKE